MNLLLPNGCLLMPGGRIRLPREQIWLIPQEVVDRLGLFLDDDAFSPASEVICMPYKQPTLDEFIAAYGTRTYTSNAYVKEKGFRHLYVRMSPRLFREGPSELTLDIANLEARHPGRGTFKRLIARLRQQYPHLTLFVEAVMIQQFRDGLLRMGFKQIGVDCFVMFGVKENVDITNLTGV